MSKASKALTQSYTVKQAYKKFLFLCGMGILASTIGVVSDTIVAGNAIGETALSAISLANPVYLLSTMVFMIFSVGGCTVFSQKIGEGVQDAGKVLFSVSLIVGVAVALLLMAIGIPASAMVAGALGASSEETIAMTSAYISGLLVSLPIIVICNVLTSFVSVDGSPNFSFLSSVVVAVGKIAFNIIYVAAGMGVFGIALATGTAYLLGALVCLLHFKREFCTLKLINCLPHLGVLGQIVTTGLPNALGFLWQAIRSIVCNLVIIAIAGEVVIAGSSVSSNISQMFMVVSMTFGYTLCSVLSMYFGERDERAMNSTFKIAMKWGFWANVVVAAILFLSADSVAGLFGVKDPAAVAAAADSMRFTAVTFFLTFIQYNLLYTFQSTKHTGLANFIVFSRSILFYVPVLYLITPIFGLTGVWMSSVIAEILCVISPFVWVFIKTRKNPFATPTVFLLPKSFSQRTVDADVSVRYTYHSLEVFGKELAGRVGASVYDKTMQACKTLIDAQKVQTDKASMDVYISRDSEQASIKIRYAGKPFNAAEDIPGTQFRYSLGLNTIVVPLGGEDESSNQAVAHKQAEPATA